MKIYELTHVVKNPAPGVATKMVVAVKWFETGLDARLLAAQKHGLESPNAWLDPAASTCQLISFSFRFVANIERGVRCVQKA